MRISSSESLLMEALWKQSPLTSEEILAQVAGQAEWSESTVRTLLNRLLNKGAVRAERKGRQYLYWPAVERAAYVHNESRGLVDRLFGGQITPFIHHFAEQGELSVDDIEQLKALIAEVEKKHG